MTTPCVHDSIIQPKIPPSIPRTASPLPQELIDIIIDYLDNDIHSLRACALVASSWAERSQQHLFSRITLAGKPWPDKAKSRTLAELFLRLIESDPHIPTLVQHLKIIEGEAIVVSDRWLCRSIPVLDRIIPALSNLQTLYIDFSGALWSDIPGMHASLLSAFKLPDVRKVTISDFNMIPSLDKLFSLFEGSNVADICLGNVTISDLTDDSQTYVPGSVQIPLETLSLSLESNELCLFSSWLVSPSCIMQLSALRKLCITILDSEEIKAFSRLLETLYIPSLEVIEIRLEALDSADSNHLPDVSRFRHIRLMLTPEGFECESEEWISASIAAWCWERLLKNFRENVIETVTFTLPKIFTGKFPEAERMHWVALDAALTRPDMSHLRRVYLEDERSQGMGYSDAVIKDILPNLYEKGFLVF